MTMKERLQIHAQIVEENDRKQDLWERMNKCEQIMGFRPCDELELIAFERNGYDDSLYAFR